MKKQVYARFAKRNRGYCVQEVEEYILNQEKQFEEASIAQRRRIEQLQQKCDCLQSQLDALQGREEEIKQVLLAANQQASSMQEQVRVRCEQELQRLKLFRAKWTSAYQQMKERYHFDKDALNMESVIAATRLDLQKLLAQDFGIEKKDDMGQMEEYFRQEVQRLTAKQIATQKKDTASKPTLPSQEKRAQTAGDFNLESALNPTQSLDEICRELGLTK